MSSELSWMRLIGSSVALAVLVVAFASCGSGGGSSAGGDTPAAPPTGSVTLTGTVSGTVISVVNANNEVISQFDTATLNPPPPPPFPITVPNIPAGAAVRIFFATGGVVYPLTFGSPETNVFVFVNSGTVDLGHVTTANGKATPEIVPTGVTLCPPDPTIPTVVIPPPASITVLIPTNGAQVQGPDVAITFALQNFTIGGQNQQHLHVYLDGDRYEFLNGSPSGQVLRNGVSAANAQWVSGTEIRFLALSTGTTHTVQFNLSTASHTEFVAPGMATVEFFVQAPPPSPAITVTSPTDNQTLPFGPVIVDFSVTNFTIQGPGQPQLHFYLDGNLGNLYQFLNGATNQVLLNGTPATNVEWVTISSFRFTSLPAGPHTLRLVLATSDAPNTELTNSQATDIVPFTMNAPPIIPTLTITDPSQDASLPTGPVKITFVTANFTIGLSGTPHLHFYLENSSVRHEFFAGAGITVDNGVLINGAHTHFAHWKDATSFELYALGAGSHQVRVVLADASHQELGNLEATKLVQFTVIAPPPGELVLTPVTTGLQYPIAAAVTPDGRLFVNEWQSGRVRVVNMTTWQLQSDFCHITIDTSGNETGLLGIAVDPAFSSNHYVYIYHTAINPRRNRVVRYTDNAGVCEAETVILDDLPAADGHNGGTIHFGPDGKLYVMIGDAGFPTHAQDPAYLGGKMLRINPADGSAPSDNPLVSNPLANPRIYSFGHRNSFGFTFHPSTGYLWQTENGSDNNDEINLIVAGGNYGWNQVEGIANTPPLIDPIAVFFAPPCNPCTIAPTGVIAVKSPHYPLSFQGNLLFGDFREGKLRRLILDPTTQTHLAAPPIESFGGSGGPLFDLFQAPDGFIYVTNDVGISRVTLKPNP